MRVGLILITDPTQLDLIVRTVVRERLSSKT